MYVHTHSRTLAEGGWRLISMRVAVRERVDGAPSWRGDEKPFGPCDLSRAGHTRALASNRARPSPAQPPSTIYIQYVCLCCCCCCCAVRAGVHNIIGHNSRGVGLPPGRLSVSNRSPGRVKRARPRSRVHQASGISREPAASLCMRTLFIYTRDAARSAPCETPSKNLMLSPVDSSVLIAQAFHVFDRRAREREKKSEPIRGGGGEQVTE